MTNKSIKDVFNLWQITNAEFSNKYEIPTVHGTSKIPEDIIPFTRCWKEKAPEKKAIHFYQLDETFVSFLGSEKKVKNKLDLFRKYQSVILPDYSIYRDMPFVMQINQVYKSRAMGNFLMQNGIQVIPNIRWGDERTYNIVFDGIDKWGVVAIGAQGGYRYNTNTEYFEKGFYKMIEELEPETVLCYGILSQKLQKECENKNILVKYYQTDISRRFMKLPL